MRRTLGAVILIAALSGCGAVGSSLPYHANSLDDSMAMTIEQYAVGRLPAGAHGKNTCAKPSPRHAARGRRAVSDKRCRVR
jgi:hypothetical protein